MDEAKLSALMARHGVRDLLHKTVLVVDDESPNLVLLRSVLEDDYAVLEATSGADALALAERASIDVVVTDERMPGMTGVQMLERLHERAPDVAGVLLTGYSDTPALISAINRARVFRYLKKPWQIEEIVDAVRAASHHVHQQRAIERLALDLATRNEDLARALDDLEEAQQQMLHMDRITSVGRLTTGVLRDLRNAAQGLVGLDEELDRMGYPAAEVVSVRERLGGLGNLIHALETMSLFVKNSRLVVDKKPVPARRILEEALSVTRVDPMFRERAVEVHVGEGLPTILADKQKLVQVIVNLIQNAVHATVPGEVVRIELVEGVGEVVFAVEDEGPGVAPEIRANLFQAFASSEGEEGVGMGLYISRLVVESHRGRLHYLDAPSGGARFEVILPV
jgi:signal transduction histidine kinase